VASERRNIPPTHTHTHLDCQLPHTAYCGLLAGTAATAPPPHHHAHHHCTPHPHTTHLPAHRVQARDYLPTTSGMPYTHTPPLALPLLPRRLFTRRARCTTPFLLRVTLQRLRRWTCLFGCLGRSAGRAVFYTTCCLSAHCALCLHPALFSDNTAAAYRRAGLLSALCPPQPIPTLASASCLSATRAGAPIRAALVAVPPTNGRVSDFLNSGLPLRAATALLTRIAPTPHYYCIAALAYLPLPSRGLRWFWPGHFLPFISLCRTLYRMFTRRAPRVGVPHFNTASLNAAHGGLPPLFLPHCQHWSNALDAPQDFTGKKKTCCNRTGGVGRCDAVPTAA